MADDDPRGERLADDFKTFYMYIEPEHFMELLKDGGDLAISQK